MSFSSGFSGFGQNNNQQQQQQQQGTGFGTGSGFGGSTTGGFGGTSNPFSGSTTTTGGGGMFGGTSGGFGSGSGSGGGFGTANNQSTSMFGGQNQNRTTGFGTPTTSGGSLFGGTTAPSGGTGFGAFGSTGGSGTFGSGANTGGSLFGSKPGGFASTTTGTGTGGFGTGGGLASTTGSTGFGNATGSAFSGPVPAADGTAAIPFNPVSEKDAGSTQTSMYQSISYMQPYQRYSFEELRLGDYNSGRRYGNGSGQAGAFGSSAFGGASGFGQQGSTPGFGSTTGGAFGGTTSAPSGFGAQTQTAGGFGSGSTQSNPLFGASKPATSQFGGASNTSQPSLFGGNTAPAGGFGTTGTTGGGFGTGGSMFGNTANNQQQQQNKTLFGGSTGGSAFGSGGGFGQTNATTAGNPFGGGTTATAGAFGGQQQQPTTGTFGGFGQQNQNQNQTKPGGLFGTGLSTGTQQQQPGGGLFGSSAGGSLFGQNNQQQQQQQQQQPGSSLFGGQNQQSGTGSMFGGNQQQEQKPGLFGMNAGTANTGTSAFGGFGGSQNNQTGSTGLFGGAQNQQQQQKPGGLFGGSGSGGSLFGQTGTAQNTGSLFGSQNQQQGSGFGTGSLFSSTQQNQQQQPQQQQPAPGSFQTSLLDGNPYGNQSIFSGLPAPNAPSPGPLATPLSASMKQKQRTPLPIYKITPNAANRLITPPRRQGYGFSYSTYGTPSSASSVSSLNGSVLGGSNMRAGNISGSFGRSFGKSFSTSNLRKSFDPDSDSVLTPGALTGGPPSRYSSGSLKRLTIDRSLRSDLFQRPAASPATITSGDDAGHVGDKLKKRVSFDSPVNGAIVRTETETESPGPTAEELGFLRSIRKNDNVNGVNGVSTTTPSGPTKPEMEQVRGNELAVVPEHSEDSTVANRVPAIPSIPSKDPQPGEYWMKPSRAELSKMNREQLKHVEGFTVGRHLCGNVTFDRPVDLTAIDLDNLLGGIVQISVRSITVYPDEAQKPPRGKGLNVPSTLRIENSWPRGRDKKAASTITSGPLYEKHVDRLRKVHNTEFVTYEKDTGVWVFRVAHFTTYGLEYEDEGESLNQSTLSAAPDTPTPKAQSPAAHRSLDNTFNSEPNSTFSLDVSFVGSMAGVDDDTFDFKKRKMVPGAFGNQMEGVEDEKMGSMDEDGEGSFLEDGSTGSTADRYGEEDTTESQQSEVGFDEDEDMEMAGSFPTPNQTVEHDNTTRTDMFNLDDTGRSTQWGTPTKPQLDLNGDWAEQLQRTISPRKQDRDALREMQTQAFADREQQQEDTSKEAPATNSRQKSFTTSIDLMNSLFSQPTKNAKSPAKKQTGHLKGLEWPYSKIPKTLTEPMTEQDTAFHGTCKPRWGPLDTFIKINNGPRKHLPAPGQPWGDGMFFDGIGVLSFRTTPESADVLEAQRHQSVIRTIDGVPFARNANSDFRFFIQLSTGSSAQAEQERYIWQLANILFNDDIEDDISAGVPPRLREKFLHRIKKDRLSRLWENIVRQKHGQDLDNIASPEERALALLTSHRIEDACKVLVESGNLHLATLLAQIGRDRTIRLDMQKQVESWRQHNVFSEMNEPIRALYELLAGNALRSEGRPSGAVEDRATTFTISERFELDWFQAFGLRLWYGVTDDEPIEAAVSQFLRDLTTGDEPAYPFPPHLEAASEDLRHNQNARSRESPLWVLLKVYAATTGSADLKVGFPAAILPESVSGSQLSSRLSFQLHQMITTTVGHNDSFVVDRVRADQLTWDYAWELIGSGLLEPALFVLLHLSSAVDRERSIKEALGYFAISLPRPLMADGTPDAGWRYLANEIQLPESWIWVAKALYARYTGDNVHEVGCLVRAKNWNEAHATFCRVVGPRAIIERDYQNLHQLLVAFGDAPDRKIRGWTSGGAVYADFLRLVTAKGGRRDTATLKRLVGSLAVMGEKSKQTSGAEGLDERVAFMEMSRVVASWCVREDTGIELSSVLKLPLTGDARVTHTAEISRRYYNAVMASAS